MWCKGTALHDLVTQTARAIQALQSPENVSTIHLFLQGHPVQAGGGHRHYTLHCDRSYGGSEEAEEAVRNVLPTDVYCLQDDEATFDDVHEAFDAAIIEIW